LGRFRNGQISDEGKAVAAERMNHQVQKRRKPPAAPPIPVPADPSPQKGDGGAAADFDFDRLMAAEKQAAAPAKAGNGTYADAVKQGNKRMREDTQTISLARVASADDGFAGYEVAVEGAEQQSFGQVIQGTLLKFANEGNWQTRDTEVIPPSQEFVVVGVGRVVQKWQSSMPIETIVLSPGQKFPDVERMNEEVPRSEWELGPGGRPRGPWQAQQILYMLDVASMDKYSFPTGTIGGGRAIQELVKKTNWIRNCKGANTYPVITLSNTFMPTRFGGRQRPHFIVKRWEQIGAAPNVTPALTMKEELNDSIPY
jgi:hypothetical protein